MYTIKIKEKYYYLNPQDTKTQIRPSGMPSPIYTYNTKAEAQNALRGLLKWFVGVSSIVNLSTNEEEHYYNGKKVSLPTPKKQRNEITSFAEIPLF